MPRPLIAVLAVAFFGFFVVGWGYTNPGGQLCDYPPWVADDVKWLPPGAVECHRHPTPTTTEYRTALPWGDWLTVLMVAASAGLFVAALEAPRRKILRAAGAFLLVLVVSFGWFFQDWLIWGALAAITAAAVVSARRWTPPSHRVVPLP